MNKIRSLTQKQLFLPIFCVFLVLCSNIIYDIAQGNAFYNFFSISIKNGVLYGRIIDILNRGSEVAILAMGMYVQSVGINKKASRIAGLNSQKIIFLCYVLCGLCAAIAGIVSSSRTSNADSNNIGLNYELDAILAVALGGNSLGGGKFNLAGSIIGAYTIQAITTTLYALGVSTEVAPVFKAVVVIVIVAIQAPPVKAYFKKHRAVKAAAAEKEAVTA